MYKKQLNGHKELYKLQYAKYGELLESVSDEIFIEHIKNQPIHMFQNFINFCRGYSDKLEKRINSVYFVQRSDVNGDNNSVLSGSTDNTKDNGDSVQMEKSTRSKAKPRTRKSSIKSN